MAISPDIYRLEAVDAYGHVISEEGGRELQDSRHLRDGALDGACRRLAFSQLSGDGLASL